MNHQVVLAFINPTPFAALPLTLPAADAGAAQNPSPSLLVLLLVLLVLALAGAGYYYWVYQRNFAKEEPLPEDDPFCQSKITQTFISALPEPHPGINLEVARTWQIEVLERSDTKYVLDINFGTNTVQIKCPVTYRYHLRLHDPWTLNVRGRAILVHAPVIRPSQPPAIHTDGMTIESIRGWCRFPPTDMVAQLHHDLTPILCQYAEDPHRLQFIREAARVSVAGFVRLWLDRENRWNRGRFTSIQVQFHDEQRLPDALRSNCQPSAIQPPCLRAPEPGVSGS